MPLPQTQFESLKSHLPNPLKQHFQNEELHLLQLMPLLMMICKESDLISEVRVSFSIVPKTIEGQHVNSLCERLKQNTCNTENNFVYRLPIVIGEYPIHSRAINKAIAAFNVEVENFYQSNILNHQKLSTAYTKILEAVQHHHTECEKDSIWQLLGMLSGWTKGFTKDLFVDYPSLLNLTVRQPVLTPMEQPTRTLSPLVVEDKPNTPSVQNPFIPSYDYNFNRAGRLASETEFLLLNAFGMKIGGHFDAQVKYTPKLIPANEFHAMIERQLSHRMLVPHSPSFKILIETTLKSLGVEFKAKDNDHLNANLSVNPFLIEPSSFLNLEKISAILRSNYQGLMSSPIQFELGEDDLKIISQYLYELLQSFQVSPGQALGIGANWDGTIDLSNESGAYAYQFNAQESEWARRFKELSLHRQGPSEAYMDAGIGVKYELASIMTDFDYMSQLQTTEYAEVLYNALVDNLVADLFPEPGFFENESYQKYRKQFFIQKNNQHDSVIESSYVPSQTGTYFKDKKGEFKQTPLYRQAGTLNVQAFPRETGYCDSTRASYAGNPLGPLQLQYAQGLQNTVRGHSVYNPIGQDQFLPDPYYGQLQKSENGDLLPFIGVVPKNFDKSFALQTELCASFVIRMLHSSRIIAHSPVFKSVFDYAKSSFLPDANLLPPLPSFMHQKSIVKHYHHLQKLLSENSANHATCEETLFSLIKNIIYSLNEFTERDENFKAAYIHLVMDRDYFSPYGRPTSERLIRYLTINKPLFLSNEKLKSYTEVIFVLTELTRYFYKMPTEVYAKEIAKIASDMTQFLLAQKGIQQYFEELKKIQISNLSRKQSPGMLQAALNYGGPSKNIVSDYNRMHKINFPSGYRDPEGNQLVEAEWHEVIVDWMAKKLGATAQFFQKYHLLAVVRRPFIQPFIQARKMAQDAEHYKFLHGLLGALKGLLWDGLIIGAWQTLSSAIRLLRDAISLIFENEKNENEKWMGLNFSAAPENEPGLKVKTSMETRYEILQRLKRANAGSIDIHHEKEKFLKKNKELLALLYPNLPRETLQQAEIKLAAAFPLQEKDWSCLFSPFAPIKSYYMSHSNEADSVAENAPLIAKPKVNPIVEMLVLLNSNLDLINRNLFFAVFKALSDSRLPRRSLVMKESKNMHQLSKLQVKLLESIIKLYQRIETVEDKNEFFLLFQFSGHLQTAIKQRDVLLQNLQNWMLKAFDESWLSQAKSCESAKSSRPSFSSKKEEAERKWLQFLERENHHQLLSLSSVTDMFNLLRKQYEKTSSVVGWSKKLEVHYEKMYAEKVLSGESINGFYQLATVLIQEIEKSKINHEEWGRAIRHFMDVTMNAIVNYLFDKVEIKSHAEIPNPLSFIGANHQWLSEVKLNNHDLRSLLKQQLEQSPSLDHALLRQKWIFQMLESDHPDQRIRKTGLQSTLRWWIKHKENITQSGSVYIDPHLEMPVKLSSKNLFSGCKTMEYALERVSEKVEFRDIRRG